MIPLSTPLNQGLFAATQGIPALLNPVLNVANTVALIKADAALFTRLFTPPIQYPPDRTYAELPKPLWGVFDGVSSALYPDSIVAFDLKKEWNVSKYIMEQGAFQSYNKVVEPYEIRLRMVKSGDSSTHNKFIQTLDALCASLKTYSIVTPDMTYLNANLHGYDMRRTATNGVGLLTVDVTATEIRNTIAPAFAAVSAPDAATPDAYTTKPQPASPALVPTTST